MLKTMIGAQQFRKGMDLYFERHDGTAATVEQFVRCFADVSGQNLDQFMLWYQQSGTPEVRADATYDAAARTLTLDLAQSLAPTPGQATKQPMVVPLGIGLVDPAGADMPLKPADGRTLNGNVIVLTKPSERIVFTDLSQKPVVSINRVQRADQADSELFAGRSVAAGRARR